MKNKIIRLSHVLIAQGHLIGGLVGWGQASYLQRGDGSVPRPRGATPMKRLAGRPERSSIDTTIRNVQYMSMLLLGRQKLMLLKSMYNTEIILKLAPPTHHNNDTCGSKLPIAGGRDKGATTTQMVRRHWISLF